MKTTNKTKSGFCWWWWCRCRRWINWRSRVVRRGRAVVQRRWRLPRCRRRSVPSAHHMHIQAVTHTYTRKHTSVPSWACFDVYTLYVVGSNSNQLVHNSSSIDMTASTFGRLGQHATSAIPLLRIEVAISVVDPGVRWIRRTPLAPTISV